MGQADLDNGSVTNTWITARRERFKSLEAKAALTRLMHGEYRLSQQITLSIASFAGGSVGALLEKALFGG